MKFPIKILGKNGKMGKALQQVIQDESSLIVTDNIDLASVIIDFSSPEFLEKNLSKILDQKIPLVSGTTGLNEKQYKALIEAAKIIPVFYSENFSLGIYLLQKLIEQTKKAFPCSKASIYEEHHCQKKDAPSGTALRLKRQLDETDHPVDISYARQGNIIGKHSIRLETKHETISISHTAHSKDLFAKGAVTAAKFLLNQPIGFYSMEDLYSTVEV